MAETYKQFLLKAKKARAKIMALHSRGVSNQDIADKVGKSRQWVHRVIREEKAKSALT